MKFTTSTTLLQNSPSACLVLPVYQSGALPDTTASIDKVTKKTLSKIIKAGDISGTIGQTLLLHNVEGVKAKRVLLVGCGKKTALDAKVYARIIKSTNAALEKVNLTEALLAIPALPVKGIDMERKASLAAQIFESSQYRYRRTVSKPKAAASLSKLSLYVTNNKDRSQAKKGLTVGSAIAKGMDISKELGNLPANICTPTYLAEQAIALGKKNKSLTTKVLSEAQMKRLGMGSLLSVSAGSVEPAAFIIMEYKGAAASVKPNVIVGKGITFDTGGISLKGGAGMDEMKFDMCGAAGVMGTMAAICQIKPKSNIIGVIASAENMPSGIATKPGDVVTSMSGQTIEILNTDAEGRLVLCDALTYVERFDPKTVLDIATLTGAVIVALGSQVSGVMSNDDDLADKLYQCGLDSLDPVWRLPIWDEYQSQLDSNFADIANIGGRKAGTITAGCFLSRFAKKYKWAHIDIAGTAWLQGAQKGSTGRPVPLLVEYLLNA